MLSLKLPSWERLLLVCAFVVCIALNPSKAAAVNVVIDYTYDSSSLGGSDFFGAGNPSGSLAGDQARAAIEAAADYFSLILTDSLAAIETPATITSEFYGTQAIFDWQLNFTAPGSGSQVTLSNPTIAADEFRLYVGGRNLGASTLGQGGPGGFQRGIEIDPEGGLFDQDEANEIIAIQDDFFEAVDTRGNPGDFGRWGGAIAFDSSGTNWNYDHTRLPVGNETDLLSVAIHEIAHTLGMGASDQWLQFIDANDNFVGSAATAEYGGPVPLDPDHEHWASGVSTTVFGTDVPQASVLDRIIGSGRRQVFGAIDAAVLTDLGWDVVPPDFLATDFNFDALVNKLDQSILEDAFDASTGGDATGDGYTDGTDWILLQRQYGQPPGLATGFSFVPEPSSLTAALVSLAILTGIKRRSAI